MAAQASGSGAAGTLTFAAPVAGAQPSAWGGRANAAAQCASNQSCTRVCPAPWRSIATLTQSPCPSPPRRRCGDAQAGAEAQEEKGGAQRLPAGCAGTGLNVQQHAQRSTRRQQAAPPSRCIPAPPTTTTHNRASNGPRMCPRLMSFQAKRRARVSRGWCCCFLPCLPPARRQQQRQPPSSGLPCCVVADTPLPHPCHAECCIFHKQRQFGEWSDDEDSDAECGCGPGGDQQPQQPPGPVPPPGPAPQS